MSFAKGTARARLADAFGGLDSKFCRETCLYRAVLLSMGAEPNDAQRSMHTMTHMQKPRKRPKAE